MTYPTDPPDVPRVKAELMKARDMAISDAIHDLARDALAVIEALEMDRDLYKQTITLSDHHKKQQDAEISTLRERVAAADRKLNAVTEHAREWEKLAMSRHARVAALEEAARRQASAIRTLAKQGQLETHERHAILSFEAIIAHADALVKALTGEEARI